MLTEHRRILREVFVARGGVEVDTQGDAFFYAFARATDALAAAIAAQEALATGPVRLRIGIHTGEPQATPEGYVGLDVHIAARIAACGHGGQVVLSRRTRELADAQLELFDLGVHRLRDLDQPVQLFQVGRSPFPPLRSLSASNLPEPMSTFVGRSRELGEAASVLAQARLVTITGPGGVGKTRFAIALARARLDACPDGVWWAPLATVRDPELVLAAMERAIGATVGLAEYVGHKQMLIVVDNFEQLVDAAPALSTVLAQCPNLVLLVTSREVLRLDGEREYALAPLSGLDSVDLFCERAGVAADAPVGELCERLDGLPLAIELAAARAHLLTTQQIIERLSGRLDLFRGNRDSDARHATLRATIEWSFELLDKAERRLFAHFAVFEGGASFEAVEAVAGGDPDVWQSLLEKSLVRRTGERLWMLETIREFALERLEQSADAADLRECHARYYLSVAEAANLWDGATDPPQYTIAAAEQANFRAGLAWAVTAGQTELGLRMATALENFWVLNDPFEAARWFDQLLAVADGVPGAILAPALKAYGGAVNPTGDDDAAERLYEQSLAEFRQIGDEGGAAGALVRLGHSAWYRGDLERAVALGEEGLAGSRRARNPRAEAQALGLLGETEFERGNRDLGLDLLKQSASRASECGFRWWQARMHLRLGKRQRELGQSAHAEHTALDGLQLAVELNDRRRIVQLLDLLSATAADRHDLDRSARLRGAIEAELEQRPISALVMIDGPASESDEGFRDGRLLSLDQAVEIAVSGKQITD